MYVSGTLYISHILYHLYFSITPPRYYPASNFILQKFDNENFNLDGKLSKNGHLYGEPHGKHYKYFAFSPARL